MSHWPEEGWFVNSGCQFISVFQSQPQSAMKDEMTAYVDTGSPLVSLTFSASLAHTMSKAYRPCHGETQSMSPSFQCMSRTQAGEDTTHTLRQNNGAFMSPEMPRCSTVFVSEEITPTFLRLWRCQKTSRDTTVCWSLGQGRVGTQKTYLNLQCRGAQLVCSGWGTRGGKDRGSTEPLQLTYKHHFPACLAVG